MPRLFLLLLFTWMGGSVFGQGTLESLIAAERNFAADAQSHSVKRAFLKHMHPQKAVVFQQGKVVPAYPAWSERPELNVLLQWQPQFAAIASSGDLGFTTGPFLVTPIGKKDTVLGRGQYTTVWQLGADGRWQFLADIGNSYQQPNPAQQVQSLQATSYPSDSSSMMAAEAAFAAQWQAGNVTALRKILSANFLLNHPGYLPQQGKEAAAHLLQTPKEILRFTTKGSGISKAGDLGFVYGTAETPAAARNFLRIWCHESAGWRLLLQTLTD